MRIHRGRLHVNGSRLHVNRGRIDRHRSHIGTVRIRIIVRAVVVAGQQSRDVDTNDNSWPARLG